MSDQPLMPRREPMDDVLLGPRILCRCGVSLRRSVWRKRRACSQCWDGTESAYGLADPATVNRPRGKTCEEWTVERVAEALRVIRGTPLHDDLGSVVGVPYQQISSVAGAASRRAAVRGDATLAEALCELRETMLARSQQRRGRFNRPMRCVLRRNEEA